MAKPDVHRAINVVLDDDVHDHVHDSSHPKAERAQALLDHLTEVNPLGHHWTTDPKMAPFFHHYNSYGPHTTNVIFHATHPEDHEIITDPGWREEHEVNDSEDEVPVHRGTDMEIKGISWKRNGDEEFTRHDFDDPDYYTASLKSQGMADYFTPRSSFPNDPGYDGNAGISDYFGGGHGGTANDRRVAGRGKPRHRQPAAPGGGGAPAAPGSGAGGAAPGQQRGDAGPGGAGLEGPRSVEFHPRAAKELRKLDGSIQKRAKQVVDALANNNGEGVQTHALANNLAGYYSSKINHDHRIVHRPTDDGGIHIIYVGLHDYDQAARRVSKLSREPGPVSFPYLRNTEGAPNLGSMYGQDVEPHGRYLRYHDGPTPEGDRWETGTASFENPLHLDRGGNSGTPEHWKNQLSEQFGGKKGKALSRAVVKAGHDGIITHDEYGPDEIVDLTSFRRTAAKRQCECCGGVGEHGAIECYACDSSGEYEGSPNCQRKCPCGTMAEHDLINGWQHLDGSVSHDGEHYGKSVSDLMKTAAHPMPTSRIFGPTYGLDHRLFEGEHLKSEVRTAVMARLGPVIEPLLGQDWQRYTKVYLAGSEASEWTSATLEGNGDFDTLIGIDYDHLQGEPGVPVAGLDDDQIDSALNAALRANYNAEPWKAPFGGEWDLTGYVNKASYDITKIKPYAAYNITDDTWAVKPPHLPDWGLDKFPEGGANLVAEAEGYAAVVDAISKMPEPFQTQQGKALWKHLHSDRGRAFSDEGEGWLDPGNALEKILVEWGVWDKLVEWQYGKQKTAAKLPEGLTFEHRPPSRRYPDDHQLVVHHPDAPHGAFDNYVGHLTWSDHDGEISGAWIAQPWQRKGIGTELFRRAKEITPELHHAPEEERSDAGQAWISGMEGRTAAGPLSIHRGIQLDPGFEPEAAQRIIDGKARPEDLLKHINTDRVGHFWYHPAHAELDDAKEFATGEEEHLKRWHGMGPEYRDEDGKVGGTVGVAMEAHHPGHWDPEENPDHGLWGNSYLPDHSHMTLHTLHYTPDDGETWHTITGLNHPLHTDGPGEAKTAAHQEPWVEHVRVDKLLPHREWQHQPGGYSYTMDGDGPYAPKHDAESWERNKQSVAEGGIQHPLIMEYNPTTHSAYLGEGNHRLHWAHELGHETVPVRMWRTSKDMPERYRIQGEPRLTKDENGYFPQDGFKPSDVLPADYFPSQEKTAGAQGDRPELTFKHLSPEENHPYGGADQDTHTMHAYLPDGSHAGELSWFGEDGMIRDVGVHPDHRRKGIASELLRRARQIQPEIHHSDALTADGAGWAGKVAMLEYFTAVKRSDHPLAPDLPQEQHEALDTEDYTQHKRKMLDLAKNPVPGTHIWRGELRAQDPVKSARETGVGIHWGVNPDTILRPQAADGEHEVVYHAEIEHPGEQNFSRNHSMWQGRHMSMDSEAEVRLKPGTKVKLHGVWYRDPYVSEKGYFTPTKPERMGKQWSYTPINEYVDVAHRPTTNLIDYGDVGVKHEGMLGYFTASEDEDYRMQHRPADEDGAPIHDLTANGVYPDDIYTHPHHYSTGESYDDEAHAVARRVRDRPDAKVKIYRSLPAEHAHQGFRPGDWVTTSKEYAKLHGMHHEDSKHDWPVISTVVPAKHLFTDGNAIVEYGYTGPHKDMPMVSFKGGYHQEIRNDKDGWIKRVKRRAPKTADYRLQHQAPDENSGQPYHHYHFASDPDEEVRIYRAAPPGVNSLHSDTWVTTDPDYAHLHSQQYDGSPKWPVMSTTVPARHLYWDENDDHEFGYQGPSLESRYLEEHDQETGGLQPFRDREGVHDEETTPAAPTPKRSARSTWGSSVAHLSPQDHADSLMNFTREHTNKVLQSMGPVKWAEHYSKAEGDAIGGLDEARTASHPGTKPVGVLVRKQGDQITGVQIKHHGGDLPKDHPFAGMDIPGFGSLHNLSDDPRPVHKQASMSDYFGVAA